MSTRNRLDIIHELALKNAGLGKTAMMKYLFLLQNVYKLPLNYSFEIYTYGPYSSEVMEDIDFANRKKLISVETDTSSKYVGYIIKASDTRPDNQFAEKYQGEIKELLELFGHKSAKELELLTTIVYLYGIAKKNAWDCGQDAIATDVHEIKPHFDINVIKREYENLDENGILARAV